MNQRTGQLGLQSLVGVAMITCLLTPLTASAEADKPMNVLFFGNSFTSWAGSVTGRFIKIAEAAGHPKPFVGGQLINGRALASHIKIVEKSPENSVRSARLPKGEKWDYVVMQGLSTEATHLYNPNFEKDALKLFQLVKKDASGNGAKVTGVLYATWARRDLIEKKKFPTLEAMQTEIREGYEGAAALINKTEGKDSVTIARVGDAFEAMGFPAWIYEPRGYHQSPQGALLAAMVIYRTIYGGNLSDIAYDKVKKWAPATEEEWKQLVVAADKKPTPKKLNATQPATAPAEPDK